MMKLFDSELKLMEILWKEGDTTAKELAQELNKQVGWSKTTTYTIIKKCIDKGAVLRTEPNFICSPIITKKQAREFETNELIEKMYEGSADKLVASLLDGKRLSVEETNRLKALVQKMR